MSKSLLTCRRKYSNAKVETKENNWQPSPSYHEIGSEFFPIGSSFMYLKEKEEKKSSKYG